MPPLERAELEMQATIDGQQRTGTFVFLGGEENKASINDRGRTGYLVGGNNRGTQILAILSELLGDEELKRKDLRLDFGGGQRAHQLTFQLAEGATDANGDHYQWGSTSTVGKSLHSATGQDPRTQEQVFMRYWSVGTYDSRKTATFRWWEASSGGLYSERSVSIESPSFEVTAGDPTITGSMTLVDTASLEQAGTSEGNTTT